MLSFVYAKGIGYGFQMGLKTADAVPNSELTLSVFAAYFLDHDARSYEMIARVFAGGSEGLTRDDVLDNVTLSWLTNTALSAARLYWETGRADLRRQEHHGPGAVSVFPDELFLLHGAGRSRLIPSSFTTTSSPRGALCGLGTAETLFGDSRGFQIAAVGFCQST